MEITEQNLMISTTEIKQLQSDANKIDADIDILKALKKASTDKIAEIELDILDAIKETGQKEVEFDY